MLQYTPCCLQSPLHALLWKAHNTLCSIRECAHHESVYVYHRSCILSRRAQGSHLKKDCQHERETGAVRGKVFMSPGIQQAFSETLTERCWLVRRAERACPATRQGATAVACAGMMCWSLSHWMSPPRTARESWQARPQAASTWTHPRPLRLPVSIVSALSPSSSSRQSCVLHNMRQDPLRL